MRDIGALRIASRAPTQSIAAAEQALQKRTAMEPRTRHDQQNGTDAISSRTDASSQPRSARSPPASLLLKVDVQTRGRTRTTKPNEHQANEHPPFVRGPGTSSIVRCSRTRRTTLRAGPSSHLKRARAWRRWAHSKHCGQRSTRPAHSFLMPSKSATQFIAGKTHSFMVGRDRYESQGQPFFGVRDASRSSISRRKVLKWTRLAIRAVVCAGSVGLPLPRPPQCGRHAQDKRRAAVLAQG